LIKLDNIVKDYIIEVFLFEEEGPTQTEDVLLICNEGVFVRLPFSESTEMIVIDDSFFEDDHELVDAVDEVGHTLSIDKSIGVVETYEIYEFSSNVEEHAVWIIEMFLKYHRKF